MRYDLRTTALRGLDGLGSFDVTVLEAEQPTCVSLFAVGRGGNPLRHLPFLQSLAKQGCMIVAPHFEMLASAVPTKAETDRRLQRLRASAHEVAPQRLPIMGIGHSIGTGILLLLAGGEGETRAGERLVVESKLTFSRLALLAPTADFFRRPGALSAVDVPIRIWAGGRDCITPPDQALFLKEALQTQSPVDISIDEQAGHFTYMDELPPQLSEPHPDRRTFLATLADEVREFVMP